MLQGLTIAVPESRQLDIFAALLEARQGQVIRVPMVSIHDAPDPDPVLAWMHKFIAAPPDLFIILTGEGVRRLLALAGRNDLREGFIRALSQTRTLCRGPKPGRALGEIGLKPDLQALQPTTGGVIESLREMDISGHRVAVQLYGEDPNWVLMDYLESRQAEIQRVAPYVYADSSDEDRVAELILQLQRGEVDVITFTSQPQFKRLQQVAGVRQLEQELEQGLRRTVVAAVGPVVRDQLEEAGIKVAIMPERTYFMKPLVMAIVRYFDDSRRS